ncbi:EAL and HDOD domain-containing protein [Undibacterium sp. SXout7W]|uniref:EAL and HDOD domain-containing protein n=1 Tax=Undibacterium sp. SXout7W TaxID=3413049 RepID=UPI003BF36D97
MVQTQGFATLLPVMNDKQQLVGLLPDFEDLPIVDVLNIIQAWKGLDFFEKLPDLTLLLPVDDPASLPNDIDSRFQGSRMMLCVPESACADKEVQLKLKHFVSRGIGVLVDELAMNKDLVWPETKQFSVNCSKGVPVAARLWLLRLNGGTHLAKNIADANTLAQSMDAGFKLFCGDYAFHPPQKNKTADGSARTRLLKLLGLVARDAESRELEELFRQDASLSFMLFKLVSSAAFAQTVRVSSFGQAINLLGRRQLQRWLQLLLYARNQNTGIGLNPLMPRAAFRASLMEALCHHHGASKDALDCAFMVGMFSLLDKLFGSSLEEVLQPLNLQEDVLDALLHRTGELGQFLNLVECADRKNTDNIANMAATLQIDRDIYYGSLIKAYGWVNQVCRDM